MNKIQEERYRRHIMLPEIGKKGQKKLLKAKVLLVGAGGLGTPVLQYLVAAGIGKIGLVDQDTVSLSNLQRQVLYRQNEIGELKTERAKLHLNCLNSEVEIQTYPVMLNDSNAFEIISNYDLVIGATDNFSSRKSIDKASKMQKKAFVHASIGKFEGQVSVFNYQNGPSYCDLFPDTPEESIFEEGVLGVLPGIIGSIQACEALKIILNIGHVLSGKLLVFNALTSSSRLLSIH